MIKDVQCKPLQVMTDDRGAFMEVLREDDPFFTRFGQSNFSMTYPGVVKAWHWHRRQDDLWFVVSGMAQVGLHDLREDSPTCGQTQVHTYDPADELRLAWDDPSIGFEWTTRNR
jgi:dTDP-4-dehydrorhamnose 3,5-epimerase